MNSFLIVAVIFSAILILAAMVLSAMASSNASQNCLPPDGETKTYSLYASICAGIGLLLLGAMFYFYIYGGQLPNLGGTAKSTAAAPKISGTAVK